MTYFPNSIPALLAAVVLGLVGITLLFTTGLGPALIVLGVAGGAAYLLYALGIRFHRRITTPTGFDDVRDGARDAAPGGER